MGIYENVIAAMQDAEEIGGPQNAEYVELMQKIELEAKRRRERVADLERLRHLTEAYRLLRSAQGSLGRAGINLGMLEEATHAVSEMLNERKGEDQNT